MQMTEISRKEIAKASDTLLSSTRVNLVEGYRLSTSDALLEFYSKPPATLKQLNFVQEKIKAHPDFNLLG